MHTDHQVRTALVMVRSGAADEQVEQVTGVDLACILELRALEATRASSARQPPGPSSSTPDWPRPEPARSGLERMRADGQRRRSGFG